MRLDGEELVGLDTADDRPRRGVAHVPQGRGTFADLTVEENLRLGAFVRNDGDVARRHRLAGTRRSPCSATVGASRPGASSGGEQQMLAIARALMVAPRLLLLDEPSLGLAPCSSPELFERFAAINAEKGTTMLVVEQNASSPSASHHRAYVLESGEIVNSGSAAELRADDSIRKAYLGV